MLTYYNDVLFCGGEMTVPEEKWCKQNWSINEFHTLDSAWNMYPLAEH